MGEGGTPYCRKEITSRQYRVKKKKEIQIEINKPGITLLNKTRKSMVFSVQQ